MSEHLLRPPPAGVPFVAGSLPGGKLSEALGIRGLFGSCGSEGESHREQVDCGGDWIFLATLGGCGHIAVEGFDRDAAAATVLVAPPGARYAERTAAGGAWSWLCLRLELASGSPLFAEVPRALWLGRPGLAWLQQMSDLIAALHARAPGVESDAVGRLVGMLGGIERLMRDGARPEPPAFVENACGLMRAAPGRDWSVAELARRCGMSASSFAHRFRSEAGVTPRQWLIEERMRVARQRLADRGGIETVTAELGFSSRYHFTRVFTRQEGMPPGRFQRLATRR